MELAQVEEKIRVEWAYMKGVDRSKARVDKTGEVFTPDWLVDEMINEFPQEIIDNTFVDTSCGDGQLLAGVILKKMALGATFEEALSTVVGCDIMESNVELCRRRLSCNRPEYYDIVKRNIIIANALNPSEEWPGQTDIDRRRAKELFGYSFF